MLRPGTLTGRLKPHGFPSIETLPVVPEMQQAGVNVFGQPSKRESLILHLKVQPQTIAKIEMEMSLSAATCPGLVKMAEFLHHASWSAEVVRMI